MATVHLTPTEQRRIDEIVGELSLLVPELLAGVRASVSAKDWELIVDYAMARVRRVLEVGALLRAIGEDGRQRGLSRAGRGPDSFARAGLVAYNDAFSAIEKCWRLAPIFNAAEGGEQAILGDIATLEAMAENRMFESLDDQLAALLGVDD